jgi:hypothetical protein
VARREAYTEVVKHDQVRPGHVVGQGDVLFRRFQCFSPTCTATLVVKDGECRDGFEIVCPTCGYRHFDGGSERFYGYEVVFSATGEVFDSGDFAPTHRAYLDLSEHVKYCVVCYALLPLAAFDGHKARVTGRQGECKMCKRVYNDLKNATRLTEQHREAADNRRLLREVSGETGVSAIGPLLDRFDRKCFNCERALQANPGGDDGYYLDHTLPVALLWPLNRGPTVLCRSCNGQKADKWPGTFYTDQSKLRALATRTGIEYAILAGEPFFNPEALRRLRATGDEIIERWAAHPDRLRALGNRIMGATGEDIFGQASPEARRAIGLS